MIAGGIRQRQSMKRALLVLITCLLAGCSTPAPSNSSPAPTLVKPKAVYLVTGQGQLAAADLSQHPEIAVVHTFRDLQARATDTNISLWIDKDAAQLADSSWLMQAPQKFCPLVVVGYNQALYAFRDTLGIGIGVPISGPAVDWTGVRLEPGFSVWVLQPHTEAASYSAVMQGYDQAPTIRAIFAITDPLIGAGR
jgi:hypothetical protein